MPIPKAAGHPEPVQPALPMIDAQSMSKLSLCCSMSNGTTICVCSAPPSVRAISLPGACSAAGERFPFSIAAALERGADNRYNNIWTYEHSRVRLAHPQQMDDPGSDYLNASFVEPARTSSLQCSPVSLSYIWPRLWTCATLFSSFPVGGLALNSRLG